MKFKLVYLLILTLIISNSIDGAEIYNKNKNKKINLFSKISNTYSFSNDRSRDKGQTNISISLNGETKINNQIAVYSNWDYQVKSSNYYICSTRDYNLYLNLALIGLKFNNYNFFEYGRNYNIINDIISWTGVIPVSNTVNNGFINGIFSRVDNSLTYRNINFFNLINNLNFALQYQPGSIYNNQINPTNNKDSIIYNINSYGYSINYEFNKNLRIGSAIYSSRIYKNKNKNKYNTMQHVRIYSNGLKYSKNRIYFAAQYSKFYNLYNIEFNICNKFNKIKDFELVAMYKLNINLNPFISYLFSKREYSNDNVDYKNLLEYISIGTNFKFNNNTSAYVSYSVNLINKNNSKPNLGIRSNITSLGLTYNF